MERCDLLVVDKLEYVPVEGGEKAPALPLLIFREGMKSSARTLALVDTGLDEGLLVSKEVRDILFVEGGPPETHGSLWAGVVEIPCEVYLVSVKVLNLWLRVRAYAPIYDGYETLVGRPLLSTVNLCLRGPAETALITTE